MGKARKVKEMLIYVYLPNNKNMCYMVKSIKAIHLIDNGSMLSIVR